MWVRYLPSGNQTWLENPRLHDFRSPFMAIGDFQQVIFLITGGFFVGLYLMDIIPISD
jgi:hypothetical protein